MQLIFYPMLFILPFKFVKYTRNIRKTNDIWTKLIKKGLALKVKPK
jgi:hypothetical protein